MLAAMNRRPLGWMEKVRKWMVCASMFWISVGSPVAWSMANVATLFSPPLYTFLPPISSVPELRLVMVTKRPFGWMWMAPAIWAGPWVARSASAFLMNMAW